MSEEVALGQRELSAESTLESFSAEELHLVTQNAVSLLLEVVKASGTQTINAALSELAANAAAGLASSAKSGE